MAWDIRENYFSVHYFDDPLLEQLSLGVMQSLEEGSALCSDTSVQVHCCILPLAPLDLCVR